jgi:hypothetical protein
MAAFFLQTGGVYAVNLLEPAVGVAAEAAGEKREVGPGLHVVPFHDGTKPRHALVIAADASVRVNGFAVVGGLRVLQHKDELVVGTQRIFYSAESTPVVEVFQNAAVRQPRCPVCRAELCDGQSVVRCPGCSRYYHQIGGDEVTPAKPCWTYSPVCRFCEHPTSLSGDLSWRPEMEEQ